MVLEKTTYPRPDGAVMVYGFCDHGRCVEKYLDWRI